jgi:hypothetical protein
VAAAELIAPIDPLAPRPGAEVKSAASWPAILAGAFVAISTSLVLFALGSGFGLAMVSPWPGRGVSATAFTVDGAIWLIVTQWLSAALGGYIAGRLRTKWVGTHTHEVFFRDTAHGLITWSVATVVVAIVLAGSATSLVGGGLRGLGGAASAGIQGATSGPPDPGLGLPGGAMPGMPGGGPSAAMTYDIDKLFRAPTPAPGAMSGAMASGAPPTPGPSGPGAFSPGPSSSGPSPANGTASGAGSIPGMDMSNDPRIEAVYIAFHAMANQSVSDDDRAYLAQIVQAQTGISAVDAQKRVDDFITATLDAENKARAAADAARKGAAEASIYTGLAMLIGAFIASVSAALGGRLRDEHP